MNDSAQEHPGVVRAYALVGMAASQFSALEFHLHLVLIRLIQHNGWHEKALKKTIKAGFAEKIQMLRIHAQTTLSDDSKLRDELLGLAEALDQLRGRRNHFIHGMWLINRFLVDEGFIRCSDTNWKFRDHKTISSMEDHIIKLPELEEIIRHTGSLTTNVVAIHEALNHKYSG